ncbi:hypothetical protein ACFYUV_08480 [Nonomuraea sp. NPDC003560]|uniref:hypothetical protein n=1 Tax=Nonomuraea sp. NPDC003560 TaxID=3364341 RepID=UPI0036C4C808
MTIEQETGRVAPVRRAMPKPGTRRPGASHQTKPRPRPDTGGRRPAAARPGESAAPARRPAARRPSTKRQRAPFVLLVVGLMCGGLVSLLLLNIMLNRDAITDAKLREEIAVAQQEKEALRLEYERKMQPQNIADRAEAQGYHLDKNLRPWDKGEPTVPAVPER